MRTGFLKDKLEVPDDFDSMLRYLETFGIENDNNTNLREEKMLNITRDTGEFLAVLVNALDAKVIVEIGTSNGYSTLWLAAATRNNGGKVNTVEISDYKIALATKNFNESGFSDVINQIKGDAGSYLKTLAAESVDLLFLDSNRIQYSEWWEDIKRIIKSKGAIVIDNAISHLSELEVFFQQIEADKDFLTCCVPIGKGEFMATKK